MSSFSADSALHNTAKTFEGAVKLYDDWADGYDKSLSDWGYDAHEKCAAYLKEYCDPGSTDICVLDSGCGTGISGEALKRTGMVGSIIGTDCSAKSLEVSDRKCIDPSDSKVKMMAESEVAGKEYVDANKKAELWMPKKDASETAKIGKVYSELHFANLDVPLSLYSDDTFDAVTCVGVTSYIDNFQTFFGEWCRTCKKDSTVVFTIVTKYWDEDAKSVRSVAEELEKQDKWKLLFSSDASSYMPKNPIPEEQEKKIYYKVYRVL